MVNTPIIYFGFSFDFDGKRHSFTVPASSEEEAQAKLYAMRKASFEGRLTEHIDDISVANAEVSKPKSAESWHQKATEWSRENAEMRATLADMRDLIKAMNFGESFPRIVNVLKDADYILSNVPSELPRSVGTFDAAQKEGK
jgi:hypothetical protein